MGKHRFHRPAQKRGEVPRNRREDQKPRLVGRASILQVLPEADQIAKGPVPNRLFGNGGRHALYSGVRDTEGWLFVAARGPLQKLRCRGRIAAYVGVG